MTHAISGMFFVIRNVPLLAAKLNTPEDIEKHHHAFSEFTKNANIVAAMNMNLSVAILPSSS